MFTNRQMMGVFAFLLTAGSALAYAARPAGLSASRPPSETDCSLFTVDRSVSSIPTAEPPDCPTAILLVSPDGTNHLCLIYCGNDPVNNFDPLGLFSWRGLGRGTWDVVTEPFKAVSDVVFLSSYVGIHNLFADTDILLEDLEYSSMSANTTRGRLLSGESGLTAMSKGYGEFGANFVTVGGYGLTKNAVVNVRAYERGEITFEEMDYNLSRGAGAQIGATALVSGLSKTAGRGWTGRSTSSGIPSWQKGSVADVEPVRPAMRTLSPKGARQYYNDYMPYLRYQLLRMQERGASAEAIGRRASNTRNALAQRTRDIMADQALAKELRPHRPIEYYIEKYTSEGFTGDALWQQITEKALTPNPDVNAALGITGTR